MDGESNDDSAELKINNNNHFQSGGKRNDSKITTVTFDLCSSSDISEFYVLFATTVCETMWTEQISCFKICREMHPEQMSWKNVQGWKYD